MNEKLSVKKFDTAPAQMERDELKAEGYRWNNVSETWYKIGIGVETHRLPILERSIIGKFTDPEYTRARDAELRVVYDQKKATLKEALGEGPVFAYAVHEDKILVSKERIPGA